MTFEELVAKSLEHAEEAERWLRLPSDPGTISTAQVEAALAEAYARLASAVIVNRTSMHYTIEQSGSRGPVS